MLPTNCSEGAILPGARAMTADVPQRIPYPKGNEEEMGVYGRLTNGQRIAGHLNEKVRQGIASLSGALLRDGSLEPRLREMIIVRTGYHAASLYEVTQHRSLAGSLGVTPETLDALACMSPAGLAPNEQAAIAFVDELLTRNRPGDATLAAVRNHFDDTHVLEMIIVAGNWWMLARMLETAGIPLDQHTIGESGVAPASAASPR